MKIGSSLLQPFLLMSVFMLWGVFLVIGEMRGMMHGQGPDADLRPEHPALAVGVRRLRRRSAVPHGLYPNAPSFSITAIPKELMSDHSTIERILLAFTTGVFYLVLPLLMLYLIAEAGGPSSSWFKWQAEGQSTIRRRSRAGSAAV